MNGSTNTYPECICDEPGAAMMVRDISWKAGSVIFGHLAFDNFFAVVAGLLDIGLGLALIRWRVAFTRATAHVQRGFGPLGCRTAAHADPRWALAVGVIFIAFGVLSICLGLLLKLER